MLRRGRGAFQADIRVGVHAALVVDLVHGSGERLLPGQGQARFTVTFKKKKVTAAGVEHVFSENLTADLYATSSFKENCVTFLSPQGPFG